MMNIREYFDNMIHDNMTEEDWDEIYETEQTLYQISEEDPDDFENFCHENGIDLTATVTVCGVETPVVTLWGWDMCGD
jgi:hypothetical protein